MMRKSTFFILFVSLLLSSLASPVDTLTAIRVADAFRTSRSASLAPGVLQKSEAFGLEYLYLFNYGEDEGFVIVSADDRALPVLAYAAKGRIDSVMPPSVLYWLSCYDEAIRMAVLHNLLPDEETEGIWYQVLHESGLPKPSKSVSPLISSAWDQNDYYNNHCPINRASGNRYSAGCVAVAMGQIMRYWEHPKAGLREHSYKDALSGWQSADFRQANYKWSRMPDRLSAASSSAQVDAVATLLFHCGVAVDMEYAQEGSGAYINSFGNGSLPCAEHAFPRYFDYKSSIQSAYREDYTLSEWRKILKDELQSGRPVLYGARSNEVGGHAFVCDGFSGDYFHFNWGWSGSYDGYYSVSALSPRLSSQTAPYCSFTDDHALLFAIEPNDHLRVDTARLTYVAEGESHDVAITLASGSTSRWSASTPAHWLHLSVSSGFGNGSRTMVSIQADANDSGMPRSDTIVIQQEDSQVRIMVFQLGCMQDEMCHLSVRMTDDCADSWNYAYLEILDSEGGTYGQARLLSGQDTGMTIIGVCPQHAKLVWHSGVWDEECGFAVSCPNGGTLYEHGGGKSLSEGILVQTKNPCSCSTTLYRLYSQSSDSSQGVVFGGGDYAWGDTAVMRAQSRTGFRFRSWQDGDTANPRYVVVDRDANYTAYFEINEYHVVASVSDERQGWVSGGGIYSYGDSAILCATPFSGFRFSHWSDGTTDSLYSFVVMGDTSLLAFFDTFPTTPASITNIMHSPIVTYVSGANLIVRCSAGLPVKVYDSLGRRVATFRMAGDEISIPIVHRGLYVVCVGSDYRRRHILF
ncbi:MAG: C10 family peptidase [Bacteroidales bacterium]|nr:C10 family peptidase [Bacteroidales bacterium]